MPRNAADFACSHGTVKCRRFVTGTVQSLGHGNDVLKFVESMVRGCCPPGLPLPASNIATSLAAIAFIAVIPFSPLLPLLLRYCHCSCFSPSWLRLLLFSLPSPVVLLLHVATLLQFALLLPQLVVADNARTSPRRQAFVQHVVQQVAQRSHTSRIMICL